MTFEKAKRHLGKLMRKARRGHKGGWLWTKRQAKAQDFWRWFWFEASFPEIDIIR